LISGDGVGAELDLMAYNNGFALGFPGGEPNTGGQFGSLLNNLDFGVLHINVAPATANPITSVPTTLANNTYWTASDATVNRTVTVTGGQGNNPFVFDNTAFDLETINKTVNLNDIEKWTITNNNIFGHAFHIHDVEFKLVSRSNGSVGEHESGWKDVLYLPINSSATFVARFDDYADSEHPFMYHCHFANHEDAGMMGQFVVVGTVDVPEENQAPAAFTLYPNPATDKLYIKMDDPQSKVYYVRVNTSDGRTVYMLPRPQLSNGIDISNLEAGVYFVYLTDELTKKITAQKFIVE
jgi:Multicopper oxidase/Secretion system C-terminal sorting domain